MKIGIIKEGKIPADKRVALTPLQCSQLKKEFPGVEVYVQKSLVRSYDDDEFADFGLPLVEDVSHCDLLLGIKEVPIQHLVEGKKYMFFSHTIKQQPHNQKLMQALLEKKIEMIDYECLTDIKHNRIIGFGRFAGIVGAYNGLLGYGRKYDLFDLQPAWKCRDLEELEEELERVKLPNIKILVTGGGRVANGAIEILGALKIRKVTAYEFLNAHFREPVYCQIHSKDYNESKSGDNWNDKEFYEHPERYQSTFLPYTSVCDLLITCHYWNPKAPVLFTKEDMKAENFRISVIADVTCDINGSVPSTSRSCTIEHPFYGYNPQTEKEDVAFSKNTITIMAVDNLPCELPRDASEDFGKALLDRVFPHILGNDSDRTIERATICKDGKLMEGFGYLNEYAGGVTSDTLDV